MLNHLLPLNLQLFAAEDGAGSGSGEPAPANSSNVGGEQNQAPQGGEQQSQNANSEPSKTPEQVQAEFLKSLGVNSLDDAKQALQAYKEFQDSQKSETQKQTEQLQSLQEQLNSKSSENANLSAKIEALSKGVRADAVEDVIKLVSGAEDVAAAIDSVLAKYPQFGQAAQSQQQAAPKPSFGTPQYNEPAQSTELDKWKAAFAKFNR